MICPQLQCQGPRLLLSVPPPLKSLLPFSSQQRLRSSKLESPHQAPGQNLAIKTRHVELLLVDEVRLALEFQVSQLIIVIELLR